MFAFESLALFISSTALCIYCIIQVIDALEVQLNDTPNKIIWFDLFSNSQHDTAAKSFEWWSLTFKSAIQQFGHVIMVLAPWHDPIPLQRAWCLFELYCTADTKSKFEIAMTNIEKQYFLEDITTTPKSIIDMIGTINLERSQAWNPEDRKNIFAAVENGAGFTTLNRMVINQITNWMILELFKTMNQYSESDPNHAALMNALAEVYRYLSRFEEALPYFLKCLELRKQYFGNNHNQTIISLYNAGVINHVMGRYVEAEPYYVECMKACKSSSSTNNDEMEMYAKCLSSIGLLSFDQSKYKEAENYYNECLIVHDTLKLPEWDKITLNNNLAYLYKKLGKYDAAEVLYTKCLGYRVSKLGKDHPDTLTSMSNLADLYHSQQRMNEAEDIYLDILEVCKAKFGYNHFETMVRMNNLGNVYEEQNRLNEAEVLYKDCLNIGKKVLDSNNPNLLSTMNSLARLYYKKGLYELSAELFEECLLIRRKKLGNSHTDTLSSIQNLATIFAYIGQYEKAEKLYIECLELRIAIIGEEHPYTMATKRDLEYMYHAWEDSKTISPINFNNSGGSNNDDDNIVNSEPDGNTNTNRGNATVEVVLKPKRKEVVQKSYLCC